MCLIVYKPRNVKIPADLLTAAVQFNADGWGLMGFNASGTPIIERHLQTELPVLLDTERRLRSAEYCLHLRMRTRGSQSMENVQPIKVSDRFLLMHNGTLPLTARVPGHSDSWHLGNDILRPLAATWPALFGDSAFLRLLELGLRPENKLALMDLERSTFVLVNRHHGAEFEELWLSSTRWIDRRVLPLACPPQPQQQTFDVARLGFS